jgi:hypothetical protein
MSTCDIPYFILIDVRDMCIVDAPKGCQHVALSYVWGTRPNFKLKESNFQFLKRLGSLRDSSVKLPRTIRDAIEVVRHSGQRYLWVDSICIIQDDRGEHKQNALGSMSKIYGSAVFTIIAIEGGDANRGIFRVGGENNRMVEKIGPGFTLASFRIYINVELDENLPERWNHLQRAWT